MRIGINAFPLAVEQGGARYALLGLLEAMLHLDKSHRYLVFTPASTVSLLRQIPCASDQFQIISICEENDILARRDQFDLYFAPLNYLNPRLNDRPTVAILHDIQEQYFPEAFSRAELLRRREDYPEICHCATVLVTVSEFCKQSFVDRFGIDRCKVEVVHNAPQGGLVHASARWERAPLPPRYLFYPANLHRHKNHALLLDAISRLRKRRPDCPDVVFTGLPFPGGYPLASQIACRGLQGRCHILTHLSAGELAHIYRYAIAVVLPTLFEGFGMPAIEALALGRPLICSDVPALREVADGAALYFPPNDLDGLCRQIAHVLDHPQAAQQLTEQGRPLADRFTWENSARRMLVVFERAAAEFRRPIPGSPPRIGIVITGAQDTLRLQQTRASLAATGLANLVILEHAGPDVSCSQLRDFAQSEHLDLVGQLRAGNRMLPDAPRALAEAWHASPGHHIYLGEVFELPPNRTTAARLRRTGDDLWKLDGTLHPEMLFLNPIALVDFGITSTAWRWALLRAVRSQNRLTLLRRTLAECDVTRIGWLTRWRALRAGQYRYYRCQDDQPAPMPLLRHLEPAARALSRRLPESIRHVAARFWFRLAR